MKVGDARGALAARSVVSEVTADCGMLVNEAPEPENVVAASTPVDGLNVNFVLVVFVGRFPVVAVTQVGYIVAFVVVSLVMPTFVAFVAVVAVEAFPDSAPVNVVAVTDVRPASVVEEDPKEMAVVPTVIDELVNAPLGMFVRPAPEPEN